MIDYVTIDKDEMKKDIERRKLELAIAHERITRSEMQRIRHDYHFNQRKT